MARPGNSDRSRPTAWGPTGFDKMQMNHRRTREQIQRIRRKKPSGSRPASLSTPKSCAG